MMLTLLRQLTARVSAFFHARDLDDDFAQELESHVAMSTEDNVRRGMTVEQARRAALIRLGGAQSIESQHRDVRGLPGIDALFQDLRFAWRLIAKEPWVSAAAIVALALGIGANTVGFTIVNAAFLRGLPFERADQLYMVTWLNAPGRRIDVSPAELDDWRSRSQTFASLAGYTDASMNISDDRALPEPVQGTRLTANGFGVLRQQPLIGRDFSAQDARPGAAPVVIISHRVWQNRYASDSNVLGRTLRIDGQPSTIISVMPDRMRFPGNSDIWVPFIPTDAQRRRDARLLSVYGRLADGADRRSAQAELSAVAQQLMVAYPDVSNELAGLRVETFMEASVGGIARPMLFIVMGSVVFVLLIACANVANLLLSRSTYRAREFAVRSAVGATPARIVRQLLVESLVLGVLGGIIGLLLAFWGVHAFNAAVLNGGFPYWIDFTIDYVVFAYVASICVVTAIVFGLAPALHGSKTNANDVLKEGGRGTAGNGRVRRLGSTLVIVELALTVVLLTGAGLMIRSFMTLYSVDLGIPIDSLMTMRVSLPAAKYPSATARQAFFDRLEPRLMSIAGVEAAAVTTGVPPLDGGERLLEIDAPGLGDRRPVFVGTVTITPTFFETLGVPIARGRTFQRLDGAPGVETAIINERLASQFFPGEDPIGRRLRFASRGVAPGRSIDVWRTIVGISPTIRHGSAKEAYLNAVVYLPYRQESPASASLLIRSALPPASVMDAVRREVQGIDQDQPLYAIQTVSQLVAEGRWWYRTWGSVLGIFAAIALLLSAMGIYAVMAYAVAQRTQEIGVRMALGAQRWEVLWLILKRGLVQLAIGLPIGVAGAFVLNLSLGRALVEISETAPLTTYFGIALLLTLVSTAACLLPARRATRIDPLNALRAE